MRQGIERGGHPGAFWEVGPSHGVHEEENFQVCMLVPSGQESWARRLVYTSDGGLSMFSNYQAIFSKYAGISRGERRDFPTLVGLGSQTLSGTRKRGFDA